MPTPRKPIPRAAVAAIRNARDATPLNSIDRLSKVKLVSQREGLIRMLETRLRILDAEPRA